jgi:cytochrome c
MFGRRAGAVADFAYSRALRESGLVWTPLSLEAWLTDPTGFVAGTTMAFAGYRSPEDRRDLIAYLLRVTQ